MAFSEGGEEAGLSESLSDAGRPGAQDVVSATLPKGLDARARGRFERLNRRVALVAFCALVIGAMVLAWTELRSAWLAHRGWQLLYEDPLNPEKAIAPFEEAVRLKRTNPAAIEGLWQAQSIMGLYDEALVTARRRLHVAPTSATLVELAQTTLRASMSPADACRQAEPYLQAASAAREALLPLEILLECYAVLGDAKGLAETRQELIERYREFQAYYTSRMSKGYRTVRATALNNVAWLMLTARVSEFVEYEQGLAYAQKAVDMSRDDPSRYIFLDTLAEAYFRNGRPEEAIDTIDEAIALEPDNLYYYVAQKRKFLRAVAAGPATPTRADEGPLSAGEEGR